MKKLSTILSLLVLLATVCVSCSGNKASEKEVKLESAEVHGDLSDYYSVSDGKYKLTTDGKEGGMEDLFTYQVKVKLDRTGEDFDFNAKDLESRGYLHVMCDLLDEQGAPIISADREGMRTHGVNSEDAALVSLKPRESGWAVFTFVADKETVEKVHSIRIDSDARKDLAENTSTTSTFGGSADVSSGSESSDVDCDQFIDGYDAFADSYIELMKKYKADPTDATIVSEYTDAASKASNLQRDASKCTDPKFASRLAEIAAKIAKAAY